MTRIKTWTRVGQIAFFVYIFAYTEFCDSQEKIVLVDNLQANISSFVGMIAMIAISEALRQLIIGFAEIIKKQNS